MKLIYLAVAVGAVTCHFLSTPVVAQTVFLSGDSNIGNPINGSSGAPNDAGNRRFFQNVLEGGTKVVIDGDFLIESSITNSVNAINSFYNGLGGVTSSIFGGGISVAALSGADLLFAVMPNDAYTAGEIAAMDGFLNSGGSIFFMGDHGGLADYNDRINAALAALDIDMVVMNTIFDSGFLTATGAQIAADPFTAGVTTFSYAAPSEVFVDGGKALFFDSRMDPFLSYVRIPEPITLVPLATLLVLLAANRNPLSCRR